MFQKILHRLRRSLAGDHIPEMIWGYRGEGGHHLANVRISNTTYVGGREHLNLGDHVFIGHFNMIDASNDLTIDEGCQVTNYVSILTHSSHIAIRLYGKEYRNHRDHKGYVKGSVHIGRYSFIGPHSVIMPGTSIGKGCIVSAYSYVQGNFPDFAIIAGNPATVTGDTRKIDQPFLEMHPELSPYYSSWSQ